MLEIVGTEVTLAIHNRLRESSLSRGEPDLLFRVAAGAGVVICRDVDRFDDRCGRKGREMRTFDMSDTEDYPGPSRGHPEKQGHDPRGRASLPR